MLTQASDPVSQSIHQSTHRPRILYRTRPPSLALPPPPSFVTLGRGARQSATYTLPEVLDLSSYGVPALLMGDSAASAMSNKSTTSPKFSTLVDRGRVDDEEALTSRRVEREMYR